MPAGRGVVGFQSLRRPPAGIFVPESESGPGLRRGRLCLESPHENQTPRALSNKAELDRDYPRISPEISCPSTQHNVTARLENSASIGKHDYRAD